MKETNFNQNLSLLKDRLRQEDLAAMKQAKQDRFLNNLVVWIAILIIGISLGYSWRIVQTTTVENHPTRGTNFNHKTN